VSGRSPIQLGGATRCGYIAPLKRPCKPPFREKLDKAPLLAG